MLPNTAIDDDQVKKQSKQRIETTDSTVNEIDSKLDSLMVILEELNNN